MSEPTKAVLPIKTTALTPAEQSRNVHRITLEERVPYEHLFKPATWAHIAHDFGPDDLIEVVPEDRSFFALLIVREVGHTAMVVEELLHKKFKDEAMLADSTDLEPKYHPTEKWRVTRKSDGEVLARHLPTK